MKSTSFFLLLATCSIILLNACIQEPDDLGYNILDDPSVEIIMVKSMTFVSQGPAYSNIHVGLKTVFDQMPPEQQAFIDGIVLYVNGSKRAAWDLPRDWFVEQDKPVGSTRCYSFAFRTLAGTESKMTEDYCFVVE